MFVGLMQFSLLVYPIFYKMSAQASERWRLLHCNHLRTELNNRQTLFADSFMQNTYTQWSE